MAEKSKSTKPRKPSAPQVPAVEFVEKWEGCESLTDAKKLLGPGASSRAARMRAVGVPLKEFAGGGRKLDVTALASLIGRPALTPKPKKEKKAKE